jgi:small subunit ribosomal protein S16
MAVHIRLARFGSKKTPFYRIVVTDERSPRDGRFIENVGTVDTNALPPKIALNTERLEYWKGKGAKPSATLTRLIKGMAATPAAS